MRLVNRFEGYELLPQTIVDLYKKEPFYFLQPGSSFVRAPLIYVPL